MIEIELFLKLIDRLKSLVTGRTEMNRVAFESHIDPIFKDLRLVYDDYRSMFHKTLDLVKANGVEAAIEFLENQRTSNERLRKELVQYMKSCDNASNKSLQEFAKEAALLIILSSRQTDYQVHAEYGMTKMSYSTLLLEQLHDWRPGYSLSATEKMISTLDEKWEKVSQKYYDLRVRCLQ